MQPVGVIDLRSDTVTRPSEEMRRAMASAEVGDDVLGEDPTVRELEATAAEAVGMEAGLFMPSGTMGNQVALHLLTRPGTEVVCEATSHIFDYEMAAMAALSGLLPRPVRSERGVLTPQAVAEAISVDVEYRAPTGLVALENTANMAGGTVYTCEQQASVIEVARRYGLPVHLDGARVFNAAVALAVAPAELTGSVDSVMFSLSKGLGAPVGSVLCGSAEMMREARRVRKMFGGGMRQVGVLAAAGIIALRDGPAGLVEDHRRARRLGEALAEVPGVRLVSDPVETNIVIVEAEADDGAASTAGDFVAALRRLGVLAAPISSRRVRLVTHCDVQDGPFERALERLDGWSGV